MHSSAAARPHARRTEIAWAFYDWANSAFAVTVLTAFFPLMLKRYWGEGADATVTTFQLGLANALGSIAIAVLAPALGAIADQSGSRKRYLLIFTVLAIGTTASLAFVPRGAWQWAAAMYVLASIGFSGAASFYDALLVNVTDKSNYHRVSALGYALGYLGGGLLFAVNVAMTLQPQWFGLPDAITAVRASFATVAIWWAIFTIPLLVWVGEPVAKASGSRWQLAVAGMRQLVETFHEIRRLRQLMLFLAAYWLYIDGVGTIAHMAIDYGLALGFDESNLILALLMTQFIAFPAAIVYGRIGMRIGPKRAIGAGIVIYTLATIWGHSMRTTTEFYVLAAIIGLVQGGVQSLSRSLYAQLIPTSRSAEFFGFYNMLGKFAAILGPLLMGFAAVLTGSSRAAILGVVVLFAAGALLLLFVDENAGARVARELDATGK
ncbi:MAG: MFS transporter [Pseudomonadota bacterium]|nr:MFS transporter [Pseudomonadota bacterium]